MLEIFNYIIISFLFILSILGFVCYTHEFPDILQYNHETFSNKFFELQDSDLYDIDLYEGDTDIDYFKGIEKKESFISKIYKSYYKKNEYIKDIYKGQLNYINFNTNNNNNNLNILKNIINNELIASNKEIERLNEKISLLERHSIKIIDIILKK
jgi:hypothetical protein